MRTRGLTLFEILLALALLAAMAALTLPSVMNSLNERSFIATADLLRDQLLLARAYAQAESETVEIRFFTSLNLVESRLFRPGRGADLRNRELPGEMFTLDDEDDADLVIAEGWALRDLPPRITIRRTPPRDSSLSEEELKFLMDVDPDLEELARTETQPVIRLAVFLPDGSALLGAPVWLSDEHGRAGKLGVNTFTGLPWFKRQEDPGAFQVPQEDEPDETESSDEADFRDGELPDTRFGRPEAEEPGNDSDETEDPGSEEDDEDS